MINVLFAILTSAAISITLKVSDRKNQSGYAILCMNYIFATIISIINTVKADGFSKLTPVVLVLGLISGFLYLLTFVLCQLNIQKNGAVMSATFMKMGIIIPIILSQVIWHEKVAIVQWLGIAVAISAIFVLTWQGKDEETEETGIDALKVENTKAETKIQPSNYRVLLVILLLSAGITDSMAKFFTFYGSEEANEVYMLLTFGTAMVFCFALMVKSGEKFNLQKLALGSILGAVNYGSAWFLLLALGELAAYFVYPMCNVLTIAVVALLCLTFFGEKLTKRQFAGLGLVLVAVVLLNI